MMRLGFRSGGAGEHQPELVRDCEAFLLGGLAERFEALGLGVPTWAWTNLLAHATFDQLSAEVTAAPTGRPEARDFRRSRAYLAAEVLAVVDGSDALAELQRRVLQPMELDLSETLRVMWWRPSELARHVNVVLAQARHVAHGPSARAPKEAP